MIFNGYAAESNAAASNFSSALYFGDGSAGHFRLDLAAEGSVHLCCIVSIHVTRAGSVPRYLAVTSDVLTSVKKMEESLRRLRTARGTGSAGGSQGMSDDDKIRLQLCLDVKELRTQVTQSLGYLIDFLHLTTLAIQYLCSNHLGFVQYEYGSGALTILLRFSFTYRCLAVPFYGCTCRCSDG